VSASPPRIWRAGTFDLVGVEGGPWPGWTYGETWNGFTRPAFDTATAARIMAAAGVAWLEACPVRVCVGRRECIRFDGLLAWNEVKQEDT
jgi:hypothetical protein